VFTQTYQQVGVTAAEANAAKAAAAVTAEKIAGEKLAQEQAAKAAAAKKLAAKEKALALTTLKPFDGPPASSTGGTSKRLTSNPCPSGAPDPLGCWHLNIQYNESFFSTGNTSEGDLLEGLCPTEEGFVIISGCGTINAAASGKEESSEGGSSSPGASSDDPSDLLNLANLADGIVAKEAQAAEDGTWADGAELDQTISTPKGSFDVLGTITRSGSAVRVSDIAMYGSKGDLVGQVGASEIRAAGAQLLEEAAPSGVDQVTFSGVRVAGSSGLDMR
jgi:hypothetical protein